MKLQKDTFSDSRAFSIIEVLIGVFIFSMGLISIYALLSSALNLNTYNKNAIIAGNLAREQIELVRNIRDTNYETLYKWNHLPSGDELEADKYYKVYENMTHNITLSEIWFVWWIFPEWKDRLWEMWEYQICRDDLRYVYCSDYPDAQKTVFYKYLYIEKLSEDQFKLRSKVIWYQRWYHDFYIDTIITDWRRI